MEKKKIITKTKNRLYYDGYHLSRRDFLTKSITCIGALSAFSSFTMFTTSSCVSGHSLHTSDSVVAADNLLKRVVPELVDKVRFEEIPSDNDLDVFELQSDDEILVIRGNNGVSMASGLNWYLKHYCHCQITFRDRQLNIPDLLPQIAEGVRIVSPYQYRYYFNYCTFAYTLAWWDWNDWEWMIDLMALYGINAPLAVTGQEGIWRNVGKRLGLSEEQMQDFYVGPGYLPFGWMGCIDRWAGPLPNSWIDDHIELQKKILKRERELGMTPVLQGFSGHVPRKLKDVDKNAKLVKLSPWVNFEPTYFVDPADPYFIEIGKIFLEEQTKLFGTNHLYASDPFIEMPPENNDPEFIRKMGSSIYQSMQSVDSEAVWMLQSWPFVHFNTEFWQSPQAEAFFRSVPQGKLLILDLYCDVTPGWPKFENAFFGQPWIWCIIQNFGGQVSLHGGLDIMAADLRKAFEQRGKASGNMAGIGYAMEGLCYNPVIDEFQSDMIWRTSIPDTTEWLSGFVKRRYGKDSLKAREVWGKLHQTVYQQNQNHGNILQAQPSFTYKVTKPDKTFALIWKSFLDISDEVGKEKTYQFDIVNVTRHALGLLAPLYYGKLITAYLNKDRDALKAAYEKMDELINDIDRQLATNSEFLLGAWLERAKRWGHTQDEKKQYEWNARKIISVWAFDGELNDYAAKQWSGMMRDYYGRRWRHFYKSIDKSLADGTKWDSRHYTDDLLRLQEDWTRETTAFPAHTSAEDPVVVAKSLYEKYAGEFEVPLNVPKFKMVDKVPVLLAE